MFQSSTNQLARIHALWTLEGLGALDAPLARAAMEDKDPQIRYQAVRASETIYKGGDKSLAKNRAALPMSSGSPNRRPRAFRVHGLFCSDGGPRDAGQLGETLEIPGDWIRLPRDAIRQA